MLHIVRDTYIPDKPLVIDPPHETRTLMQLFLLSNGHVKCQVFNKEHNSFEYVDLLHLKSQVEHEFGFEYRGSTEQEIVETLNRFINLTYDR